MYLPIAPTFQLMGQNQFEGLLTDASDSGDVEPDYVWSFDGDGAFEVYLLSDGGMIIAMSQFISSASRFRVGVMTLPGEKAA